MIDLSMEIKDKYVALEFKHSLADDICDQWLEIDCTNLHNELFESIKTGDDIIKFVES